MRTLLWRLVNPSAAFGHVVRRCLFLHRMAMVLREMAAFQK